MRRETAQLAFDALKDSQACLKDANNMHSATVISLANVAAMEALQAELAKPPIKPVGLFKFFPESNRYKSHWAQLGDDSSGTPLYSLDPSFTDGMLLVRVEPTESMIIAGFECDAFDELSSACVTKGGWPYSCKQSADAVASIYKAMINAAKDQN